METKECKECGEIDDIHSFRLIRGIYRGKICSKCRSIRRKERHEREKKDANLVEIARKRSKQWRESEENREKNSEYHKLWKTTDTGYWSQKINTIRSNCKSRGLEYDIDRSYLQDLYDKQNGKCEITGRDLIMSRKDTKDSDKIDTCSVDRIDNSKGYIKDNVRLVTLQANAAKLTGTDEELLAFCEDVIKIQSSLFLRDGQSVI